MPNIINQIDPQKTVTLVFSNLLSDSVTRPELTYLIGRAEKVESFTFVSALGFLLSQVEPDFSPRREGETAEAYVTRLVKFLISKEQGSAAQAVENILQEMSDLRGSASVLKSLRLVIKRRLAAERDRKV